MLEMIAALLSTTASRGAFLKVAFCFLKINNVQTSNASNH
jgi:hypothetical protein